MSESSRLLIVGLPRSGTTLLTCLVGSHPECVAMSECLSCEEGKIVSPAKVIANKLCCPNQVQLTHPPPRTLGQRLLDRYWNELYIRLRGGVPEDYVPGGSVSISGYVEQKDAQLLFILREPNQVIDSIIRRGGQSRDRAVARWANGIQEMSAAYAKFEGSTYVVKFSDLITKTEQLLQSICKFVNLNYHEEMVGEYKNTPQYNKNQLDSSVIDYDEKDYYESVENIGAKEEYEYLMGESGIKYKSDV